MLKNYLTIALRSLRKQLGYSLINITGLAIGMTCCLVILLFVRYELGYDQFHEHADRIYRIQSDWGEFSLPATNPRAVHRLKTEYPELTIAHFMRNEMMLKFGDERFQETNVFITNPAFFDVFSFEMLQGDGKAALTDPYSAILSESTARRFFGDVDAIGKTMTADDVELTVTGIVADAPPNSHFHYSMLISWATLDAAFDYSRSGSWSLGNNSIYTYFLLPQGYDPATLNAQFPGFIERHFGDSWIGATLSLQALSDIHLRSHHGYELSPNGQESYVYFFSAIALFILLVACINFMNLATARSAERAKEVGVRKALGARRAQLIGQFLSESVVLSLLALGLAVVLTALALPVFRALSGVPLDVSILTEVPVMARFLMIALSAGVFAGSYPSFFLSAFRPTAVLKGRLVTGKRGTGLRKGLVVFQFATSVFLIAGTAMVYSQHSYLQNANLGFAHDQVVSIPVKHDSLWDNYPAFQEAVLQVPGVAKITTSSVSPPGELLSANYVSLSRTASEENSMFTRTVAVGHGFFETLDVEMAYGRAFSLDFSSDSTGFVVNETAARRLMERFPDRISSLDRAVGMELLLGGQRGVLLGITADFNMASLHEAIEPTIFFIDLNRYSGEKKDNFLVRVRTEDLRATMSSLEAAWASVYPEWPLPYSFVDEAFDAAYRTEQRLAQILGVFAGLAILIACLGLLGLAAFTAQQRTKEIGVRKVLGASVPQIAVLLSKDMTGLVVIAVLLATPISYVAMQRWLADFAYQVAIGWWIFPAAGAAALLIAWATVGYQSVKAAIADPVESLRYE